MTEVPEHLLQRSRARRAALGLGGDEGGAPAPATTSESAPAAAAPAAAATPAVIEPAAPAVPEIVPAYIQAARTRKKIPIWAVPVLALTPIWVLVFALTLDKPTASEPGPLLLGAQTFSSCAGCHGGSGGGGSGPALSNGAVLTTFPEFADQLNWVMSGTQGFKDKGLATYGATDKPVGGGGTMPAWGDSLTAQQLIGVVRHERETLSGEAFDPAVYDQVLEMIKQNYPDKLADFQAAVDEFSPLPPDA